MKSKDLLKYIHRFLILSFLFCFFFNREGNWKLWGEFGQAAELRLHLHEQLSWPNRSLPLKMRGLNTLPSCLASIHTALCIPWMLQFLTGASLFRQLLVRLRRHCHSGGSVRWAPELSWQLSSGVLETTPIHAAVTCWVKSGHATRLCALLQDEMGN